MPLHSWSSQRNSVSRSESACVPTWPRHCIPLSIPATSLSLKNPPPQWTGSELVAVAPERGMGQTTSTPSPPLQVFRQRAKTALTKHEVTFLYPGFTMFIWILQPNSLQSSSLWPEPRTQRGEAPPGFHQPPQPLIPGGWRSTAEPCSKATALKEMLISLSQTKVGLNPDPATYCLCAPREWPLPLGASSSLSAIGIVIPTLHSGGEILE